MRGTGGSFEGWRGARRSIVPLALAAWALAGCSDVELAEASGRLEVAAELDLGAVSLGRARTAAIVLRNVGRAPLTLLSTTLDLPAPPDFALAPGGETTLGPGDTVALGVTFAPVATGSRAVRVRITTDSARSATALVEVRGEGVLARAELGATRLDFGRVAVGTGSTLPLTLTNPATHPAEATVARTAGDDADAFRPAPAGDVTVPPATTAEVRVEFAPHRMGPFTARLPVQACPTCATVEVELAGEGIAATLSATPRELDYGYAEPRKRHARTTTVENLGSATVRILDVRLGGDTPGEFALDPLAPPVPFDLPGQGTFDATVAFTPDGYDRRAGTLRVKYADPSWPGPQELVIPVGGAGGGPDVEAAPNPLSWPRTAVGLSVAKRLVLRNTGRDPAQPLVVTGLEVRGSAEFHLSNQPTLPVTIAPGAQVGLGVTYAPLAGGRAEGELVVRSNDADEDPYVVRLNGSATELGPCRYEVVPQRLDFGAVGLGRRVRLGFTVRNTGTEPCAVANVRLSPGTDPSFAITPLSTRMVDPGDALLVPVEFEAASDRTATGEVLLDVSSPTAPHARVLLVARGLSPCLTVDPDRLDFGAVGLACAPPVRSVMVRNTCSQPVGIASCDVGTGASDAFTVDPAASGPRTLAPGDDLLVPVTYDPDAEGDDLAPLYVATSLSPAPLLVPLSGRAQLRPTHTDAYTLPPRNQVDFLFVVDNSGSFTEEQDALARNFDAFIRTASANGTDYHVAVTTSGLTSYRGGWADCPGGVYGGEAGRFFPVDNARPRVLTPQTPDVRAVFEQNVKVGICHWWEEGLEASRLALSEPLVSHADDARTPEPADGNGGFLRPDASLYVLYVSDEDDSGLGAPDDYVRFLLSLKPGRPDLVHASAILGLPSCPTAPSVGTRYMQVVGALGGIVADICSPDWNGIMDRIGQDAFRPQTTFPLSRLPDGRDVTVSVAGADVPRAAQDGSRNWRYDPAIGAFGAVVFDEPRAPGPGDVVEITYPVPCPPPR